MYQIAGGGARLHAKKLWAAVARVGRGMVLATKITKGTKVVWGKNRQQSLEDVFLPKRRHECDDVRSRFCRRHVEPCTGRIRQAAHKGLVAEDAPKAAQDVRHVVFPHHGVVKYVRLYKSLYSRAPYAPREIVYVEDVLEPRGGAAETQKALQFLDKYLFVWIDQQ